MDKFKKLGLNKKTTDILQSLKFSEPTPIQEKTIPLIMQGKDVIGQAATGSGKTLAFVSGIIEKTIPGQGIQALILTPTRELAIQISNALSIFSTNYNLKISSIYGGVDITKQIHELKKTEIVVGTPGRILDHLQRKTINFSKIKTLVLDEADRMVDMGFIRDVEKIISQCNKNRQTLLFSATTSYEVDNIAKKYLKNPIRINVKEYVDASKLKQIFYDTPPNLKLSLLVHLLKKESSEIVMVFCNTRRNVELVAKNLKRYDINAIAIHGGLEQKKRDKIIERFHKKESEILVCTDVAARGLDIKGVSHVYNYDIPSAPEDYIHRIGRTARAGKQGMAINIVSRPDYDFFWKIREEGHFNIVQTELPEFEKLSADFSLKKQDRRQKFVKQRRFSKGKNRRQNKPRRR